MLKSFIHGSLYSLIFLSVCQAAAAANLSDTEILELLTNRTLWYSGRTQGITYRGTISFKDDGTVTFKDLAGISDKGKWWVENGQLCRKYKKAATKTADCQSLEQSGMISYRLSGGYQFSHHVTSKTKLVQRALKELGYDPGPVDGAWGGKTRKGLNAFRQTLGLKAVRQLPNDMIELLHVISLGAKRSLVPAAAAIGNTQVRDTGTAIYLAEDGRKIMQLPSGRKVAAKWWRSDDGKFCEHIPSTKEDICEGAEDPPWIGYKLGNYWLYFDKSGKRQFQVAIEKGDTLANQQVVASSATANDIIAALEKQELANPTLFQKSLGRANRKPPSGASRRTLMKFFVKRGDARVDIGLGNQARSDYQRAAKIARRIRAKDIDAILLKIAITGAFIDPTGAQFVRELQSATKAARDDTWRLSFLAILSANAFSYGYQDIGARALKRAVKLERKFRKASWWSKWGPENNARIHRAKYATAYMTGRYETAEKEIRKGIAQGKKSLRILNRPIDHYFLYTMRVDLGHLYKLQGRYTEAEIELKEALLDHIARNGRYNWRAVRGMYHLVSTLARAGRNEEAERLAELTIETANEMGMNKDNAAFLLVRSSLAEAKLNVGDVHGALEEFARIKDAVKGNKKSEIFWLLDKSDYLLALALSDKAGNAAETARQTLKRATKIEKENHLIRAAYAIALARSGSSEAAYAEFQKITPALASFDAGDDENTVGSAKEQRIRLVLEAFMDFLIGISGTPLEKTLKIDAIAEAFRVADAARSSSVQRALSASSARVTAGDSKLAKLVREQQDVSKRLSALKALLSKGLSRPTDQQNRASLKAVRKEIGNLNAKQKQLTRRVEKEFPSYAELLNPRPPSITDVQSMLGKGEAYLSIYTSRRRSFIWAVPQSGKVVFTKVKLGTARMTKMVQALRDALNPSAASLGGIPDFDLRIGHRLYSQILKPVEAVLKTSKSLLVTSNGALGELPLSVLPTKKVRRKKDQTILFASYRDVPWLARTHAVTVVPSAASLMTLRSLPAGNSNREPFIGFGDPYFNSKQAAKPTQKLASGAGGADISMRGFKVRGLPLKLRSAPDTLGVNNPDLSNLPPLPDTADEVRGLALSMSADLTKSVITGLQANEAFVKKTNLSGYRVVAFATHGLVPGELSGLEEPALALSAPSLSKSKGDGLLTMSEILQLKLDADWVVLSACNTGSGRGNGAEAVSGLGRAFFFAGTRSLLVSSWPVETTSARLLTTDVFARQTKRAGITRAQALRQAMVALIDKPGLKDADTGTPLFYYAHPIFWGPFILVGDGGA